MNRRDRGKIYKLRKDGYFRAKTKTTQAALATVKQAAEAFGPREPWLDVFMNVQADGAATSELEVTAFKPEATESLEPSHAVYLLFGRADNSKAGVRNGRVLANWLRFGLNATGQTVATASDVERSYASQIKSAWEDEIRALLADARVLGLRGDDLYHACTTPHYQPTRIAERLAEVRQARTATRVGALPTEWRAALYEAWFDYRVEQGRKGRAPDEFDLDPPFWFVQSICDM